MAARAPQLAAALVRLRAISWSPAVLRRDPTSLVRNLRAHGVSLEVGRSPLKDGEPWIQFGARDHVMAAVQPGARVLEFGSGGSTLFWLALGAEVVSIEHDPNWANAVRTASLESFGPKARLDLRVAEPVKTEDSLELASYSSAVPALRDQSFMSYVYAASDIESRSVDLLVVDGRARPAVLLHNHDRVKRSGLILLDNSERKHYQAAQMALEVLGWKWRRYFGPVPYLRHFSESSVGWLT